MTGERVGTVVAEEKGILGRDIWRERRRLDYDGESYREGIWCEEKRGFIE